MSLPENRSPQGEGHEAGIEAATQVLHGYVWHERLSDVTRATITAYLSHCPSPVSGTEPPPVDEDAAYWRKMYEELFVLQEDGFTTLLADRDEARAEVERLRAVSGTEPDTAGLVESLLRIKLELRGTTAQGGDAECLLDSLLAGFSVDAGKEGS